MERKTDSRTYRLHHAHAVDINRRRNVLKRRKSAHACYTRVPTSANSILVACGHIPALLSTAPPHTFSNPLAGKIPRERLSLASAPQRQLRAGGTPTPHNRTRYIQKLEASNNTMHTRHNTRGPTSAKSTMVTSEPSPCASVGRPTARTVNSISNPDPAASFTRTSKRRP